MMIFLLFLEIENITSLDSVESTVFANETNKPPLKDKLKFTTIGDYKIKMQLNKLGVSTSIIEDNMNKIDEHIIEEKIKKIIEKDKKTNKKYSGQILKNKIYNHLLNQGYSQEKVITIINTYDF